VCRRQSAAAGGGDVVAEPGDIQQPEIADVEYVTSGALSDEFSPTASPGSPLDSDEALDEALPPELLCRSDLTAGTKSDKDDTLSAGLTVSQAKHLTKVRVLMITGKMSRPSADIIYTAIQIELHGSDIDPDL